MDLKALLNVFLQMVSIISMNVNKIKLSATKGLTISYETWFTVATLIEIGITEVDVHVLVNVPRRIECVTCYFDFNTQKNTFPLFLFCYNNTVNFLLVSDYIKLNFISRIIINSYSKATIWMFDTE